MFEFSEEDRSKKFFKDNEEYMNKELDIINNVLNTNPKAVYIPSIVLSFSERNYEGTIFKSFNRLVNIAGNILGDYYHLGSIAKSLSDVFKRLSVLIKKVGLYRFIKYKSYGGFFYDKKQELYYKNKKIIFNGNEYNIKDMFEKVYNNEIKQMLFPVFYIYYNLYPSSFLRKCDKFFNKAILSNNKVKISENYSIVRILLLNFPSYYDLIYSNVLLKLFDTVTPRDVNKSFIVVFYIIYKRYENINGYNINMSKIINPDKNNEIIGYNYEIGLILKHFDRIDENLRYPIFNMKEIESLLSNSNTKKIENSEIIQITLDIVLKYSKFREDIDIIMTVEDILKGRKNLLLYLYIKGDIDVDEALKIGRLRPHKSKKDKLKYLFNNDIIEMFEQLDQELSRFVDKINLKNVTKYYNFTFGDFKDYSEKYILDKIFKDKDIYYDSNLDLYKKSLMYKKRSEEKDYVLFIPLGKRKCEPEMDQDEINLNEEDVPVFAIGNRSSYSCFDIERVSKIMELRKSLEYDYDKEMNYIEMDLDDGKNLYKLIKYSNYPDKERISEVIKKSIQYKERKDEEIFNNLKDYEKLLVKDFFLGIFYIGMITRRWNPDDEKYPMEEKGTEHGDRGISEDAMSVILTQNYNLFKENILDSLTDNIKDFLNVMKCMTKHGNEIEIETINSGGRILFLLYKTFEEKNYDHVVCQRIASNAFITTADYGLKKYFSYQIDNFDIYEMETII